MTEKKATRTQRKVQRDTCLGNKALAYRKGFTFSLKKVSSWKTQMLTLTKSLKQNRLFRQI